MKKFDIHTHFGPATASHSIEELYRKLLGDMNNSEVDKFAIMVSGGLGNETCRERLENALWFKEQQLGRVYVFGGLFFEGYDATNLDGYGGKLVAELEELMALGCDGLKILFGKPGLRKALGVSLDDSVLTPLFNKLEETNFPVLWHIADPAEFWDSDPRPVPQWADGKGWTYDDSYPAYELIKAEAENVFNRHPKLNLVLPHFYFMSEDLVAAAEFLERHPNISIDTAPGVEMCHNCSTKVDAAREFFIKYDSRILFGTDCGMDSHTTSLKRSKMVQGWLEEDGDVMVPADDIYMMPDTKDRFNGLNLPEESLRKIYSENFGDFIAG